jgi:AcrR family transcriptional regulator
MLRSSMLVNMRSPSVPLSGRRRQAVRNDERILEAARAVFVEDPSAPISAVAAQAGVGIAALYRRYPSKEDLLSTLCAEGLRRYIAETEAALADDGDPWRAFTEWMTRVVEADTHSFVQRLAGTFTPTEAMYRDAAIAQGLNQRLFNRTSAAGAIRDDVELNDVLVMFEMIAAIRIGDERRTRQLRHRYLAVLLDALHQTPQASLPGPPPGWQELNERWAGSR